MPEQTTNPAGESAPRTDWDIGKALNGFFPNEQADEEGLEADAAPVEGTATDDEEIVDEASGDEEAETDDEETSDDEPFLVAKVNGKDIPVKSREEAIPLVQKGLHYTQEMQALRSEQQKWADEKEQITAGLRQKETQYETALRGLSDVYGHVLGNKEPDWASPEMQKLKSESPNEYVQVREQWDQLGAIRSEMQRINSEKQADQKKQWDKWVANEQAALAEKRPEWSDANRRTQDWSLIQNYATAHGISEQEISNLYDHRFWLVLHDAARYRQAETAGKKKVATSQTKTAEPGSGKGVHQGDRRMRQDFDRLKSTGDVRAAGNIFQDLMTRKK